MRDGNLRLAAASDEIVAKELEGEIVIVNMATGLYYSLNPVGSFVWIRSHEEASLDEIHAQLRARYADADLAGDLERLVDRLVAEKIAILRQVSSSSEEGWPVEFLPVSYSSPDLTVYDDVADMIALDPPLPESQQYKRSRG